MTLRRAGNIKYSHKNIVFKKNTIRNYCKGIISKIQLFDMRKGYEIEMYNNTDMERLVVAHKNLPRVVRQPQNLGSFSRNSLDFFKQ